jgi:hypothetical protein
MRTKPLLMAAAIASQTPYDTLQDIYSIYNKNNPALAQP